jgi:MoaA/NifB/PqqE/SkfB family radical SAM enzyme
LDELADTLFEVEFYNWGEPLLNKSVEDLIAAAHARGIATTINSNFSIPFDDERAERLVKSGLDFFAASIGGASQDTYEQYRRGGDFALVMENCRKLIAARTRLGASNPVMHWNYHVFEYNQNDIEPARAMAEAMGFETFFASKGHQVGPEWDPSSPIKFFLQPTTPRRCVFPWQYAVINNDGGVSPCCGTFYREDDFAQLKATPDGAGASAFHKIWNSPNVVGARRYFGNAPDRSANDDVCRSCPVTVYWQDARARAEAGVPEPEGIPYTANDSFNYFFSRRPKNRDTRVAVKKTRPTTPTPV